ncbi:hypothetical protein IW140_004976 [Coemansia sp. RSA 1813]|nr:hypothetical protein EV178_005576 [Coemansia sp. RSA 1646]KAJ1768550.1 hypothetical protein LPJ74_004788 [Coemansia sp. RSA 1843]KAJ2086157.1 hypothetical protein IW138_005873 [Coemansia sp. RSA 986]KAJ2210836.1 hypothetical protein EV179_005955 [Coemansia sp. RSA 487]KAJ2566288.1 hypothetical protein IW140_004976 [Coemansia sp. RSA 1813]
MAPRKLLLPDISAADLDGLVIVSGPRNHLPATSCCTRRKLEPGLTYRPIVEVRDGSERLYSKNSLPLFEIIGARNIKNGSESETTDDDKGPAGAVLRRRRSGIVKRNAANGKKAEEEEDISDEHYRKLHRKPEYVEKRIRNREIELYQYSRWQESQHKSAVAAAVEEAATESGSDALPPVDIISEALRKLDSTDDTDSNSSGHRRQRRRKELLALVDSNGYQKAQQQIHDHEQQLLLQQQKQQQREKQKLLRQTSEHDRKMSRLGGVILEQLLVQASHFPPKPPASLSSDLDNENTEDEAQQKKYPCCPREFSIPPRLYSQVIKHRNINATD